MTLHQKLAIAAAVLILFSSAIAVRIWIAEHDARITAEAKVKSDAEAFDKLAEQIKADKTAEAERDRQTASSNAAMLATVSALKTPTQIVPYVNAELPNLPKPAVLVTPAATLDNPTPKPVLELPAEDLPVLRDRFAKCDADAASLSTCNVDKAARDRDAADAQKQIKLLTDERDEYKKEAGKTFWARAWNGYIKPGIFAGAGAGVGYAIGRAAKK